MALKFNCERLSTLGRWRKNRRGKALETEGGSPTATFTKRVDITIYP